MWLGVWDSLTVYVKCYSKSNRTQQQKYIQHVWQIGAALFYYKLGQTLLQIGAA